MEPFSMALVVPIEPAMPVMAVGADALLIAMTSVEVLFTRLLSPPPETVAPLVAKFGAVAETFTVTTIGGKLAPGATESERVQVKVGRSVVQPVPLSAVAVSPDGSAFETDTDPVEPDRPILVTTMEQVRPLSP